MCAPHDTQAGLLQYSYPMASGWGPGPPFVEGPKLSSSWEVGEVSAGKGQWNWWGWEERVAEGSSSAVVD